MYVSIRVKDHLNPEMWQDWFEGLQITQEPEGTSLLTGPLPDQPALFGGSASSTPELALDEPCG